VGGVERAETTNDTQCQFFDLRHFIINGNEQGCQVLSLCQMRIKLLVQKDEDTVSNLRL